MESKQSSTRWDKVLWVTSFPLGIRDPFACEVSSAEETEQHEEWCWSGLINMRNVLTGEPQTSCSPCPEHRDHLSAATCPTAHWQTHLHLKQDQRALQQSTYNHLFSFLITWGLELSKRRIKLMWQIWIPLFKAQFGDSYSKGCYSKIFRTVWSPGLENMQH